MGNGVPIVTQAHAEGMPTNLNVAHTYHVPIHGGSQAGTEDHDGDFFVPRNESVYEPFGPPQIVLERKLKMMDERVRATSSKFAHVVDEFQDGISHKFKITAS